MLVRRELMALQAENYALEKKVYSFQVNITKTTNECHDEASANYNLHNPQQDIKDGTRPHKPQQDIQDNARPVPRERNIMPKHHHYMERQ